MKVYVESIFDCPPDRVWAELQSPSLLIEVMQPLARVRPVEPAVFPERWEEGKTVYCYCWILGIIPIGRRRLHLERIDGNKMEIQSRESDPVVKRWDHLIKVEPAEGARTRYSDSIEIDAGILTPFVWLWAKGFYLHRQRRWRKIVVPRIAATGIHKELTF